jgi:predicted ester cyclase
VYREFRPDQRLAPFVECGWLHFELQETIAEGGTVMAAAVMTGQHIGLFNGIAPTGRSIAHKQVHIFTIADGQITRHRAVRDDLGLLLQLGWRPGNPTR